jgi:hypothetical protein
MFKSTYINILIERYNKSINLDKDIDIDIDEPCGLNKQNSCLFNFEEIPNHSNKDIEEYYYRINHIIPNFKFELQCVDDNTHELENESIYKYINKYIIFENCYYNNNGKWYQNMYYCEEISNYKKFDKTIKIPLLSSLQFIKCKKEMSFISIGQLVLDELKNLIFVVMDVYYPYNQTNEINNSIYTRINYLNDIINNHYIYSQLDIFIIKSNNIFLFNKENIEYYLKNTLLNTQNNENKLPIQGIQILNQTGQFLIEIETCNSIHFNYNEWNEFINKKYINYNNELIIYKHIFDFNIKHNIQLKTDKINENQSIQFMPDINNSAKKYNLYTFKNYNSQSYLSSLSDIYYVSSKDIEINIELENNCISITNETNIDPIINECEFYEKYFLVYIPNIKLSKLFRKLYKEAIVNKKGFWYQYTFSNKLNKFIPID